MVALYQMSVFSRMRARVQRGVKVQEHDLWDRARLEVGKGWLNGKVEAHSNDWEAEMTGGKT